jgi:hypothetical protein
MIFGRKKREAELYHGTMKALAEGHTRATVNKAAGTIGATFKGKPDNTEYCINAVAAIVPIVMRCAGCDMDRLTQADVLSGSLFAFTYSSHLSALVGAQFEIAAPAVLIPLFSREVGPDRLCDLAPAVIDLFNHLTVTGPVITDIGQRFAEWINEPTDAKFDRMVESFAICVKAVAAG